MKTYLQGYKTGGTKHFYSVYNLDTESYITEWTLDRNQAKRSFMISRNIDQLNTELHLIIK